MASRDESGLPDLLAIALLLSIIAVSLFYGGIRSGTHRRCLAAGYPKGEVSYTLDRYCIRRVDQTDVVVPLAKAEAH